jgi:putative SOS response-associated peptidase YedK
MEWGLEPLNSGEKPRILVRAESSSFPSEVRCLVPANDLPVTDRDGRKWAVRPKESGKFFCFAGVWRPRSPTWPMSYALVTVPSYPDLQRLKDRHVAFMPKELWADWLGGGPAMKLLQPLPEGSLNVMPVETDLFEGVR